MKNKLKLFLASILLSISASSFSAGFVNGVTVANGANFTGTQDVVQLWQKAFSGQTADIMQIMDSTGATKYFKIDAAGDISSTTSLTIPMATVSNILAVNEIQSMNPSDPNTRITIGSPIQFNNDVLFSNLDAEKLIATDSDNSATSITYTADNSANSVVYRDADQSFGVNNINFDQGVTLNNGAALRTDTTNAHTAVIQAYSTSGTPAYKTFATLTNGAVPVLEFSRPLGTGMTWNGGPIGNTTPATGAFTTLSSTSTTNIGVLTASQIVATDASKNLVSVPYSALAIANNIALRDGSGSLVGNVLGNSATATALQTARNINGVSFNGTANITIQADTGSALTVGTGLQLDSGTTFNGSTARTISIDSTVATLTGSQVLTNKTLTAPIIGAASGTSLSLSGLTASSAVATDGSKNLVSVTNTGTGNNVLATSPTLVTPNIGVATGSSLTLSAQPLFYAYPASTISAVTGDGTTYNPIFSSTSANVGSSYNTSTGLFTAPATGWYVFTLQYRMQGLLVGNTSGRMDLLLSTGVIIYLSEKNYGAVMALGGTLTENASARVLLTAGQTVQPQLYVAGNASKNVNIFNSMVDQWSYFAGYKEP